MEGKLPSCMLMCVPSSSYFLDVAMMNPVELFDFLTDNMRVSDDDAEELKSEFILS